MGCAPCEAAKAAMSASRAQTVQKASIPNEDCEYTIEQVDKWLERVKCVYNTGVYIDVPNITKKQLNSYTGTLLSAKNYTSNVCYFRSELEEIEAFITVLTLKELCNN